MIRHGRTSSGRQRWRCKTCQITTLNEIDSTAKHLDEFLAWLLGRRRQVDLPGGGRSFCRRCEPLWQLWPFSPIIDEVHEVIFVDGIHLGPGAVVLIAQTPDCVLGWYVAKGETTRAWQALMSRIAPPDVVVCDGGQGIASAVKTTWPTTRIQRCVFHAYSAVKRKTTTRPRTQAGVDLYSLAQALLEVTTFDQAVAWMSKLATWNTTYKEFLAQRTRLPDGRWVATHARLIQAKNSLNTLVKQGTLFTYLDPALDLEGDPIARTSNLIEGGINTQLRCVLRAHRGMSLNHQVKTVLWWCYLHTEFPATPAHILKTTLTDQQIIDQFDKASHRAQAQAEIDRWGTAVNWTDFYHSGTWHETY